MNIPRQKLKLNSILNARFIIILIGFSLGCSKEKVEQITPSFNTQIVGKVMDFDPNFDDYTINLLTPNIITDDTDNALAFVDSTSGKFKFNFDLKSPEMMIVRYARKNFYVYATAGDSIHIRIDVDDEYPPNCQFTVTNSKNEEINVHLDKWLRHYYKIAQDNKLPDVQNSTFFDFRRAALQIKTLRENDFDSYVTKNKIQNEEFKRLVGQIIQFGYVGRLIGYKIRSDNYAKLSNKSSESINSIPDLDMEQVLPLILDSLKLEDPRLLENSFFYYFFNYYTAFTHYVASDLCKLRNEDCSEELIDQTYKAYVVEEFDSLTRDLLLSRYLYGKTRAMEIQRRPEIEDQFLKFFDSSRMYISKENQTYLLARLGRVKDLMGRKESGKIRAVEQSTPGLELWDEVIGSYHGKMLYVKFWAPWCGPCMSNWKSADNLAKSYSPSDLKVLAVCIDTEESKWKETILNLTSAVDHIYLDGDQSNLVKSQYRISTIPRNLIVDQSGTLVFSDAPESGGKQGQLNRHLEDIINRLLDAQ